MNFAANFSAWSRVATCLIVAAMLGGCGVDDSEALWEDAVANHQINTMLVDAPDDRIRQQMHQSTARYLTELLDRYPDADENLRRVISDIRDGEQELAENPSGSDADALRERHEELWSHLINDELPPDYR